MLIQIILVFLVGIVLTATLQAINRANDKTARSSKINEAITEMRFITFEHMLNHEERSLEQWQSKYQTLAAMLAPKPADSGTERQILGNISSQHQTIKSLFDRLVVSYNEPAASQDILQESNFQDRLAGQLLVKQQEQIAEATKLTVLARADITAQQVKAFWLVLGVILLMLLVTFINAWVIMVTITSSLGVLQQGAAAVATGDLDYRIPLRQNDEFGQLATAFNAMAASLKQTDQTKSEFILMVSHQLRTPATAVKGFISLLIDGYTAKLSAQQADLLKSAYGENERQLQLVDEMLVVAQAETGEMVLSKSPTDLGKLIDAIAADQTPVFKQQSQIINAIRPQSPLMALVDAEKVRIVIENLLTNAGKYSPTNSVIEITLRQSAAEAIIEVKDSGIGITKGDLNKLFKKFSRLAATGNNKVEGAGLGLYLAKKIVTLHRGKITVSSQEGRGSVFAIHLPLWIKGSGRD